MCGKGGRGGKQDNDCSLCFCSFGQNGNGLAGNGKTFGRSERQRDRMMCRREREVAGGRRGAGRLAGVATTCNR